MQVARTYKRVVILLTRKRDLQMRKKLVNRLYLLKLLTGFMGTVGFSSLTLLPAFSQSIPNSSGMVISPDGKQVITQNGARANSSGGFTVNSDGTLTSSEGTTITPNGTITSSQGITITPSGAIASPQGATITPDGTLTAPNGFALLRNRTIVRPDGRIATPTNNRTILSGGSSTQ